tara:strand:+ start:153 stop:383 length:231 start_codon:yes stop_codon:yes gene_type:complete
MCKIEGCRECDDDFYDCKCCVCEKPINVHKDFEEQCNECLAYGGRDSEYDIDYSDKSKLNKYQLKMIQEFDEGDNV